MSIIYTQVCTRTYIYIYYMCIYIYMYVHVCAYIPCVPYSARWPGTPRLGSLACAVAALAIQNHQEATKAIKTMNKIIQIIEN